MRAFTWKLPSRSSGLLARMLVSLMAGVLTLVSVGVQAASDVNATVLERLDRLEQRQEELARSIEQKDARIAELESQLELARQRPQAISQLQESPVKGTARPEREPAVADTFGVFQPGGRGFKLAETPYGDVNFSAWTYFRYLNQLDLDSTYTDSFGRTRDIDKRNDFQLNKANLYFRGWLFDPRFRYMLYTWTQNTAQGEGAQVVVAGNLSYKFNNMLDVGVGITSLPGTRSLRGTWPYWLKVDSRPIADEFFRPSYTSGIWASGNLTDKLKYKVMAGDNLSQLGVNASRLDNSLNTFSGSLWWMPTTGEFGPADGYGDFEVHDKVATMFGLQVTRSREDRQSQPGEEDILNSQIRLSDGTVLFSPDAFLTDGRVNKATYLMTSMDAAVKYRGYSLEGEYYFRWVDDFATEGDIPEDDLFDHGFQLQASAMLRPQLLQAYVAGSKIYGEYGNPWDLAVGFNYFPFRERLLRVNTEVQYLDDSPVGYSSVPFALGGNGLVFNANLEMYF